VNQPSKGLRDDVSPAANRRTMMEKRKPKLLCVDDEPHVVEGVAVQLRKRYEVTTCTDPFEALRLVKNDDSFAVVLSDLRMPGIDGVHLLGAIKAKAPRIARVLLTGYGDFSSAVAAVNDASVHRFLTKPCRPDHLERALDEALAIIEAQPASASFERLGKLATLGSMAGNIGHEVSNLVTALQGSLEIVRDQVNHGVMPSHEDFGVLDMVKLKLSEHAAQLKNLARPKPVRIEPLDVGALACECSQLLKRAGILRRAAIRYTTMNVPVFVLADRSVLEGAIMNLLKNAAEALDERAESENIDSGWEPEVHLQVVANGITGSLIIEDNGVGMTPEARDQIFDSFFTTKPEERGTGLGLAIAVQAMDQCGGSIEVDSELGQFTRFTINLRQHQG
jgi:signal transduction histidine kinase